MADLLIELGCEELPAAEIPRLTQDFSRMIAEFLASARIDYAKNNLKIFSTPRRLTALCTGLALHQAEVQVVREGPKVGALFDFKQEPTAAAKGFARACNIDVDTLLAGVDSKNLTERIKATVIDSGQPTLEYLADKLPALLTSWSGYKFMRWGIGKHSFIRPLQNLVIMLDSEVVPCSVFGIAAGSHILGHRVHCPGGINLQHPADYQSLVGKDGYIIPGYIERESEVVAELQAAVGANEVVEDNPDLVVEVTNLVEYPQVLRGEFAKKYLTLPAAVLHEVINNQQKCFLVYSREGKIVNSFLMVANLQSKDPELVVRGNQKVVSARLNDAEFFIRRDADYTITKLQQMLEDVVFHPKLGSMADKSRRIAEIAVGFAAKFGVNPDICQRAAELAKCDLVTHTVQEWPSLEGVFGGYLLAENGEDIKVSSAVIEHVKPRNAQDSLPQSHAGLLLAFADRLDSALSFASLGLWPKSDKDAYGMRRIALALARLLVALGGEHAIDVVLAECGGELASADRERLGDLIRERHSQMQVDKYGSLEWVMVNLAMRPYVPVVVEARLKAMAKFQGEPEAEDYWAVVKRVDNFLKGCVVKKANWSELPGSDPAELMLGYRVLAVREEMRDWRVDLDFYPIYKLIAGLRGKVDDYFDNVLINVDDKKLRENRQALAVEISSIF